MKNKKKGFTLVELLVVIAILAVLASVSVVGYMGFTAKAKEAACREEAAQARTAMVAALVDGEEGKFKFTDGVLTDGTSQEVITAFGLTGYKGKFAINNVAGAKTKITYTLDGYTATFDLVNSEITMSKAPAVTPTA